MNESAPVNIDVWSDYVCPFCYLEEPVLDQLAREQAGIVKIRWHAFELRPDPVPTLDPLGDYLKTTWARSVYPMAAARGMALRLPPVQPRSRKAFEAVEHAREHGRFDAMHRALFRAFFEDGKDIGNLDVLVDIGVAVGLDAQPLRDALEHGIHTRRVLDDEDTAQALGIRGVPMMVISPQAAPLHEGLGVSGAQPYEAVAAAVAQVHRQWAR
jgi:predicted DsbA family dithiol-disulfide isomerase